MFTNPENYNHGTGRLSRQLAVLFADFLDVSTAAIGPREPGASAFQKEVM